MLTYADVCYRMLTYADVNEYREGMCELSQTVVSAIKLSDIVLLLCGLERRGAI
jgi:hypothetical protein